MNGYRLLSLFKNMTAYPFFRKYSADLAPLDPVLKFSIDLTVFFSRGTLVPPEVTNATGVFEDFC